MQSLRDVLGRLSNPDLWLKCARMRNIAGKNISELTGVIGKDLRIILPARNCNIGHAVVEQVFCAEFGINVHEHALGGLPLTGITRHGIAVVNMRMLLRIDGDITPAVQFEAHPSISAESLHGSKFTIGNL